MEITQQSNAFASSNAQATTSGGALSADFDTFLTLLTAQLENQDPLEPVDSTEYVAQLATFSSVEQQVTTNDLLRGLGAQLGLTNMADMAGWVGMEARVAGPAYFDGTPITIAPNPVAIADTVNLIVRDENGNEVQRRAIPASTDEIEWAGVANDGSPLPVGTYQFEIESSRNGEVLQTDIAEVYSTITEARGENGGTVLILDGGVRAVPADVTGLRGGSL
ncbi:flagellar hook capping FlgD N-terminal domain-containing protein [Parasulfitobacter algicola]|uniref:Basal-body rod modification protein FlgD n=1 Tax=Parasulfitobacter algicola TaxID=2614809 RepID=A0ABX2IUJ4_9RHOB|nr:flagellar hook capping FlgD N-terminal domain-containing protein [Sulfitobacter algicola]NSX56566.1 flagellar hook assembly protein FlgD [Sulfitobacter algicola]